MGQALKGPQHPHFPTGNRVPGCQPSQRLAAPLPSSARARLKGLGENAPRPQAPQGRGHSFPQQDPGAPGWADTDTPSASPPCPRHHRSRPMRELSPRCPPLTPSLLRTSSPEPWPVPGTPACPQLPWPPSGQALTPHCTLQPQLRQAARVPMPRGGLRLYPGCWQKPKNPRYLLWPA